MQIFARLTKVNEADRTVEGIIASEAVDKSGEIFDYEKSVPHFKAWSEGIAKATDGKNLGNVRVMHGKQVAGITKALNFDDTAKQITVKAEIVDDNEWNKVKKGCYTGFSIGGKYGSKWEDPVAKAQRYEAIPNEYSLVDLPCNPEAQFTVVKADGSEELRKFETSVDDAEALQKWVDSLPDEQRDMLAKIAKRPDVDPKEGEDKYGKVEYADPKNKKYPLDTAKHIKAAWSYIHMPKNAKKYSAEDCDAIKAKIAAAWKDKIDDKGPPESEKMLDEQANRLAKHANAAPFAQAIAVLIGHDPQLEKGLWAVSQFAALLQELAYMADGVDWEEEAEGDDSTLPAQMRAALKPLAQAFLAMAEEEVDEALHGQLNDDAAVLELAAKADMRKALGAEDGDDLLAKAQAMREKLEKVEADLAGAQESLAEVTAERDGYAEKLVKFANEHADWLTKRAEPKGAAKVVAVEKTLTTDPVTTTAVDDSPVLKADGTVDHMETAVKLAKAAYTQPMTVR